MSETKRSGKLTKYNFSGKLTKYKGLLNKHNIGWRAISNKSENAIFLYLTGLLSNQSCYFTDILRQKIQRMHML